MTDRNYFVEDAKNSRIIFNGTKEECDEWVDEHLEEYKDKILIIREGANGKF